MKHPLITPKFSHILHGGDYSPEQWSPEGLKYDIKRTS